MLRFLAAFAVLLSLFLADRGLAQNAPPEPPPRSSVYAVSDSAAVEGYREVPSVSRRMAERLVLAATNRPDVRSAWQSLVGPKDIIGIKVSTAGGPFSRPIAA